MTPPLSGVTSPLALLRMRLVNRIAQVPAAGTGDSSVADRGARWHTGERSGPEPGLGRSDATALQHEVERLRARCRAHEHALERLSAAVLRLRQAHVALFEENTVLRRELERCRCRRNAGVTASVVR